MSGVPPRPAMHYKPDMQDAKIWGPAPTLDDIARMASDALETLEEPFRTHARAVAVKVEDFADEETLKALSIENPYELTGLYSGVAMTLETPSSPALMPPMVWLYRLAILDEWASTGDITLEELVAHVVIHEFGHHFGWSDEEIDLINDSED